MFDMEIEDFGMALGFADEMTQEERDALRTKRDELEQELTEAEDLATTLMELEDDLPLGPVSLKSRHNTTKDVPLDGFAKYLDAVLRGEVDVDWAVFNRQGI